MCRYTLCFVSKLRKNLLTIFPHSTFSSRKQNFFSAERTRNIYTAQTQSSEWSEEERKEEKNYLRASCEFKKCFIEVDQGIKVSAQTKRNWRRSWDCFFGRISSKDFDLKFYSCSSRKDRTFPIKTARWASTKANAGGCHRDEFMTLTSFCLHSRRSFSAI